MSCYQQLVDTLVAVGERDRARRWCIRGYKKTQWTKQGIAAALQKQLRLLAEEEGRFGLACAYRAEDFFDAPSEKTFSKLRQSSGPFNPDLEVDR